MKKFFKLFFNHIKTNYIKDFDDTLTPIGRFFIKPAWFVNSLLIYSISLILFPFVSYHMMNETIVNETIDFILYGYFSD